MEPAQESLFSDLQRDVIEHSTTRRNNVWRTNEDKVNSFTGSVNGDFMEIIREESRQIYIIGGNTPAIYFDLNESPLFVEICNHKQNADLDQFLFTSKELSISKYNHIDEKNIEDSIKTFQDKAKILIEQDIVGGMIRSGMVPHFHEKVHDSKSILLKLYDIVHDEYFIIQQNRDIYRELCNHASRLLSKNEISNVVQTRWNQDLDRCLFSDHYDTNIDMNMLGCLVQQFIEVIQLNQVLGIERRNISDLQLYSRNMVKKARLEMKEQNDLAWKQYPGRWNYAYMNLRNTKIEENKMEFYRKTDWTKLKNDFDSDVVERKKQAQIHHTSYVRGHHEYYKNIERLERNKDDAHKQDHEIEQFSGEDTKNKEQAETETEAGGIEQGEIEQEKIGKKQTMQSDEIMPNPTTYKIWTTHLKQETTIPDIIKEKINKIVLKLKNIITTKIKTFDEEIQKELENFKKYVKNFNPTQNTYARDKILSKCYLEIITLIKQSKKEPGGFWSRNFDKLIKVLEKIEQDDYIRDLKRHKDWFSKTDGLYTAYINPYLI